MVCFNNHLVQVSIDYVVAQVEAGAEAIQIFDSWVGALMFKIIAIILNPSMDKLINGIKAKYDVPVIMFEWVQAI